MGARDRPCEKMSYGRRLLTLSTIRRTGYGILRVFERSNVSRCQNTQPTTSFPVWRWCVWGRAQRIARASPPRRRSPCSPCPDCERVFAARRGAECDGIGASTVSHSVYAVCEGGNDRIVCERRYNSFVSTLSSSLSIVCYYHIHSDEFVNQKCHIFQAMYMSKERVQFAVESATF